MNKDIPVFLIHGLGSRPFTLWPLALALWVSGYKKIHLPYYPASKLTVEDALDYVDLEMRKLASVDQEIIVVGQSMGGLLANLLHKKGWKIRSAVYIGAPLHGARLLRTVEALIPGWLARLLHKKPYDFLKLSKPAERPPHPYYTIGMSMPFCEGFDGKVYKDEAMIDEERHTQLSCAEHAIVFVDPRLWVTVANILNKSKHL